MAAVEKLRIGKREMLIKNEEPQIPPFKKQFPFTQMV
jgi:hypothetical protein